MPQSNAHSQEYAIIKTGQETAEKFRKTIHLDKTVIQIANDRMVTHQKEIAAGLDDIVQELCSLLDRYMEETNDNLKVATRRLLLSIKAQAGMTDQQGISMVANLLFELFDDGYDLRNHKVRSSIKLYQQTLLDMARGRLVVDTPSAVTELQEQLYTLNQRIR